MWEWLTAFLVWLSAHPHAIESESPHAAGAVACAYAQFATDADPQPAPTPKPGCCDDCGGKGFIVHGDGHKTPCPCPATCRCKAAGATLTPDVPAVPEGRR